MFLLLFIIDDQLSLFLIDYFETVSIIIGDFCLKFKYLVIIFNVIIVFFLLSILLLPFMVMGPEFAVNFWKSTWLVALVLILVLIGFNVFFLANHRFFRLLEREDWPALAYYLEQQVYGKSRYSSQKVRLLVNSYLVMCDFASISRLESKLEIVKPALITENLQVFGAARILSGDYNGAVAFYTKNLEKGKLKDEQWIRWFLGFSQMLTGSFNQAELEFKSLAATSGNGLITGLSAYFLGNNLARHSLKAVECRSISENGRERVRKEFKNIVEWKKEMEKAGTDIHTAIIRKYIDEAGVWLFDQ